MCFLGGRLGEDATAESGVGGDASDGALMLARVERHADKEEQ